jgi:hypothetical protein
MNYEGWPFVKKGKKGTRFKKSLDADNEKEIIKDFGG